MPKTLSPIAGPWDCVGKHCPVVYRSNDGRYFVQGYKVDPRVKDLTTIGDNEELVEVPRELLRSIHLT